MRSLLLVWYNVRIEYIHYIEYSINFQRYKFLQPIQLPTKSIKIKFNYSKYDWCQFKCLFSPWIFTLIFICINYILQSVNHVYKWYNNKKNCFSFSHCIIFVSQIYPLFQCYTFWINIDDMSILSTTTSFDWGVCHYNNLSNFIYTIQWTFTVVC